MKEVTFLLSFLLGIIQFNFAQYTIYDCSTEPVVLGENTSYDSYEVSYEGNDTILNQYDTIYFELGKETNIFLSDSNPNYFEMGAPHPFNGYIKLDDPNNMKYVCAVRDNYHIYYHLYFRNIGSEISVLRAKIRDDSGVSISPDFVFDSYLWSTGDNTSSILSYTDSANIVLKMTNGCNHSYNDSIIIAPQNQNVNFIIGDINDNIKIIDKEYPVLIEPVWNQTITIPIDLNGDNINDVDFWIYQQISGQGTIYTYRFDIRNLANTNIIGVNTKVTQLDSIEIFSNQFEWLTKGTLMYYSSWRYPQDTVMFKKNAVKYVGFLLEVDNEKLLGWMKLVGRGGWPSHCSSFELLEVAIQKEPTFYLGINDLKDIDFKVYPNPASNVVNIEFDAHQKGSISLFDMSGRIFLSQDIDSQEIKLNVENLTDGVYFLSVKTNNTNQTYKIVKSN